MLKIYLIYLFFFQKWFQTYLITEGTSAGQYDGSFFFFILLQLYSLQNKAGQIHNANTNCIRYQEAEDKSFLEIFI